MPVERLATGIASVDRLLGGGLESDGLTELYGEAGSGKTLFCLDLAARVTRADRWVFYIDTEGVAFERIEQLGGGSAEPILRRLLIASPKDLQSQSKAVETACSVAREGKRPIGLIVLDSATLHYRLSLQGDDEEAARQDLMGQLANLLATSIETHVPVVFTNQVWRNVRDGTLEPLGGSFIGHVAKTILRFERGAGDLRTVVLVKHRSRPEGQAEFRITSTGLVDAAPPD